MWSSSSAQRWKKLVSRRRRRGPSGEFLRIECGSDDRDDRGPSRWGVDVDYHFVIAGYPESNEGVTVLDAGALPAVFGSCGFELISRGADVDGAWIAEEVEALRWSCGCIRSDTWASVVSVGRQEFCGGEKSQRWEMSRTPIVYETLIAESRTTMPEPGGSHGVHSRRRYTAPVTGGRGSPASAPYSCSGVASRSRSSEAEMGSPSA